MELIVFNLPGLYNSGPQHWQTYWENEYGFKRIEQNNWEEPVCDDWIKRIDDAIASYSPEQVILVGHSLACCTIVKWAEKYKRIIKGALLVAPSDTEAPSYPGGTIGFTPMPSYKLPFPSLIIASSNDEYVSLERARFFADNWGSELIITGALGHINSASKLGNWPEGYEALKKLMR